MTSKFLNSGSSGTGTTSSADIESFLNENELFFSANKVGVGKIPSTQSFEVLGDVSCTGSFIGPLNANTNKIINVSNGTNSNDAVNKSQLDTKASSSHSHVISDVTGLQTAIDGKASTTHSHIIGDVTGLQGALDAKLSLTGGTISGSLTIDTNLTVNGTTSYINTTNFAVSDPLTRVADTNPSDTVDIGMYGKYVSGGTKYTGIFRDATDNKYKYFHGLTEEPTTTVNTAGSGYTKADVVVGDVNAVSITSATNSDLTIYRSGTGINRLILDSDGITSEAIKLNSDGGIDMNHYTGYYTVLKENGSPCAAFGINTFATSVNVPYTMTHQTNAGGQNFTIWKTGSDSSKLLLESDSTSSTDSIHLKSNGGGLLLECPTTENVSIIAPLLITGHGTHSNGIVSGTIPSNSTIPITKNTNMIKITGANTGRCLLRLSYSGSLLEGQRITILNKSGVGIVLGHLSSNSAGSIKGKFYEMADNEFLDLLFDSNTTFFNLVNRDFRYNRFNLVRWTGDQTLELFISSAQTYIVKINYNNATGTINGVSGFDNLSQASTTGTNWTKNGGTSSDYTGTGGGYYLTDTESAKMYNIIHTLSSYQFTITGLTANRDYILCVYYQSYDNSSRPLAITDGDYSVVQTINQGIFSTNTTNSNACIGTYIFRSNGGISTQRQFTITGSIAHVFAITCALLA